ncbi:hypothetical protein [Sphingosinicella rhizophila]|uniref:Uncharacterized protein n=1 Tax=Sphingosinicella rhizophila TaxID=3050082 RepID=A0ABU3Q999_9SPHN|nr:hypothetical protein [Sphingosinicella sp. GR2756]MDT9599578.1 hypothetical protein [Sphingosinicella sp. GR2756]
MSDDGHDLSGAWTGLFNYPAHLPQTEFQARLRDLAGSVTGETTETGGHLGLTGTAHGMIEGHHEGGILHFTKIYDDLDHAGHPIHYRGTIAAGGDEIEGRWDIPGAWSGTFLMIRNPAARQSATRKARQSA